MTTLELPVIAGKDRLTHSSETCFKVCPRKFQLQYRLGLRPAHKSNALRIGSAFHAGIEVLRNGGSEGHAADHVTQMYANEVCPPWLAETLDAWDTERETALAMVRGYARRWAGDMILQFVAVEQSFDLPITNPDTGMPSRTFRSAGKIDGIAKLPDGRLALVENKTTSEDIALDADYWRRLQMDAQVSRYVLAARELGYDVQTTCFDVTRKPLIRPKGVSKADRALATSQGHYFDLPLTDPCPERETALACWRIWLSGRTFTFSGRKFPGSNPICPSSAASSGTSHSRFIRLICTTGSTAMYLHAAFHIPAHTCQYARGLPLTQPKKFPPASCGVATYTRNWRLLKHRSRTHDRYSTISAERRQRDGSQAIVQTHPRRHSPSVRHRHLRHGRHRQDHAGKRRSRRRLHRLGP